MSFFINRIQNILLVQTARLITDHNQRGCLFRQPLQCCKESHYFKKILFFGKPEVSKIVNDVGRRFERQ